MRLSVILASAAALATASTAFAADSRQVNYGDLNLASQAGAAAFKARVRSAAEQVCDARSSDLASTNRARACVDRAMTGAAPAVERAIVTARGA